MTADPVKRIDVPIQVSELYFSMLRFEPINTHLQLSATNALECGYAIYRNLLRDERAEDMVLFESLGRSSEDARSSIVALDPCLTVQVRGLGVEVRSDDRSLDHLRSGRSFQPSTAQAGLLTYRLEEPGQIFDVLRDIEAGISSGHDAQGTDLSFFGYFSYDAIRYIEPVLGSPVDDEPQPDISLTLYRTIVRITEGSASITHYAAAHHEARCLTTLRRLCEEQMPLRGDDLAVPPPHSKTFETNKADYLAKCRVALDRIRIGDIYQVQIGHKLVVQSTMEPIWLYGRLRQSNPSPYMFIFSSAGKTVVGASPELFVRVEGGVIAMRPIAGTVGKNDGICIDAASRTLKESQKETAEHMMLVDLCRNDICRVVQHGTLDVPDLMEVEEYSHVYHMVSHVTGRIGSGVDKYDIIRGTFPAGTMTGAPKISAMQIIEELEDSRRGHYAGLVGMFSIGSNAMNSALFIRSAVFENGMYAIRASAGIVADSDPNMEYRESLYKMSSVFHALTGEVLL